MPNKTFTTTGIVLRRTNVGETDRIMNLLTQEYGKISCVAKGVRKISSTKRAFLEPGNIVTAFLVSTKSLPLLTQAKLHEDCSTMPQTLPKLRQLTQLLEFYETLFVEEELEAEIFTLILELRSMILKTKTPQTFSQKLAKLITLLGYQDPEQTPYANLTEYISVLAEKPMKSFEYLKI